MPVRLHHDPLIHKHRITVVMVSHFLIELHETNEHRTRRVSFLSVEVMSRLDTLTPLEWSDNEPSDSTLGGDAEGGPGNLLNV